MQLIKTTHVYVAPDELDRFGDALVATFGGTKSPVAVIKHHPDPQDHVDDRGYLKLWLKQNEAENIYIRALLRDDQQTAERANAEVQRLDRLMHRHQPRAEEDEDESDERDESHDQF